MKAIGIMIVFIATFSFSAQENTGKQTIRYRQGKQLDFESLLIEGHLKRPEISVVTGNAGDDNDGLLRLRENFLDQIAIEAGVAVP